MIPNNLWSSDTSLKPFNTYGQSKPEDSSINYHFITLGPEEVSLSSNSLTDSWWLFEYADSVIKLYKHDGDNFIYHSELFTPITCVSLSAAFDQLGKPLVFFDTGSDLRLWWYDPELSEHTKTIFGVGTNPFATFDLKYAVDIATSDILLFYIRDGDIYYRQQRDRYSIEYTTPVTPYVNNLLQADMSVDYRMQLLYRYIDTGYVPPTPTPPIVVPDPPGGRWEYSLTGYGSKVEFSHNMWQSIGDDLFVSFDINSIDYETNKQEIILFSQSDKNQYKSGSYGDGSQLIVSVSTVDYRLLKVICGGVKSEHYLSYKIQPGSWSFKFFHSVQNKYLLVQFKAKGEGGYHSKTYQHAIGTIIEPSIPFVLGGNSDSRQESSFRGVFSNIEVISGIRYFKCPCNKKHDMLDNLTPIYSEDGITEISKAKIYDYRVQNWIYKGFT